MKAKKKTKKRKKLNAVVKVVKALDARIAPAGFLISSRVAPEPDEPDAIGQEFGKLGGVGEL